MKEEIKERLCKCEQDRRDCRAFMAYISGKPGGVCLALNDTHFDRVCPFYKSKKEDVNE